MAIRKRPAGKGSRVHVVEATLNIGELARAGNSLELVISARGQKLGELRIGSGALYWKGRSQRTPKRISWSAFADMLDGLSAHDIR